MVNEAEDALLLLGREIYQRGGLVVRPVLTKLKAADDRDMQGWHLVPVTQPYLVETLTCAARFLKYDGRSKAWVPVDAPDKVAQTYLARRGTWKLPILSGIVHTPFLRADGSICEQPGYDPASGLLFKPDGRELPADPAEPSKDDALAALAKLDAADRDVPLRRRGRPRGGALGHPHRARSPLHGDGAAARLHVADGRDRQVAAGRHGRRARDRPAHAGDRRKGDGGGAREAPRRRAARRRRCHLARQLRAPPRERVPLPGPDAGEAQHPHAGPEPERGDAGQRHDLRHRQQPHHRRRPRSAARCCARSTRSASAQSCAPSTSTRSRPRAATAAGWLPPRSRSCAPGRSRANAEALSLPPLGSFEQWSRRIREPLVWLGRADPCGTIDRVRENDPTREALWTVVVQWEEHLGHEQKYAIQDVIRLAAPEADFQTALVAVASNQKGLLVSNDRLGRWLKKVQGKVVNVVQGASGNSFCLSQAGSAHGYPLWKLSKLNKT